MTESLLCTLARCACQKVAPKAQSAITLLALFVSQFQAELKTHTMVYPKMQIAPRRQGASAKTVQIVRQALATKSAQASAFYPATF
ncbi:MAG: hypothetical protein SFU55_10130 [Methylophilus sp.]|nr:hypothetical protein [Methylophilus sp.]